jgi:hypothetical protein
VRLVASDHRHSRYTTQSSSRDANATTHHPPCQPPQINQPIEASNIGSQMMQKMGWGGQGKGLGKAESGIVEPVKVT